MRKAVGLCSVGLAFLLAFGQSAGAQGKGVRRALLVNVTLCADKDGVTQLGDPTDRQIDLMVMSKALARKGFAIKPLEYDQATKLQVLKAMDDLAEAAQPGDSIVFYFTGHGYYDKQKGMFSLCPWDVDAKSSRHDITEGDIKKWLDKINKKTRNVTLILDSCYSEVAANGRPSGGRYHTKSITRSYAKPSDPGQPMPSGEPIEAGEPFHITTGQAVILSASNQNGIALQVKLGTRSWSGLFTSEVADELNRATDKTTYGEFMDSVRRNVEKWVELHKDDALTKEPITQSPTAFGEEALMKRPLFADVPAAAAPPPPPLPPASKPIGAVTATKNDEVQIETGANVTLSPGSKVEVKDMQGNPHTLVVQKAVPNGVLAAPEKNEPSLTIPPGTAAVPTHAENNLSAAGKIKCRLDGTPEFQAKMQRALSPYPFLGLVTNPGDEAQMILRGALTPNGIEGKMLESDGITSINPNNRLFAASTADGLVEQFSKDLNQLAVVSAMLKLDNPARPFLVTLNASKPQYHIGDEVTFTCKSEQDCYVFLYAVDSAGFPSLLFPLKDSEDNHLLKGQDFKLPPDLSGLTFRVAPPAGFVKVAVLAVLDPRIAEKLKKRLIPVMGENKAGQPGERGGIRAVEDLQKLQLGPLDTWMTNSLNITVLKNEAPKEKPVGKSLRRRL